MDMLLSEKSFKKLMTVIIPSFLIVVVLELSFGLVNLFNLTSYPKETSGWRYVSSTAKIAPDNEEWQPLRSPILFDNIKLNYIRIQKDFPSLNSGDILRIKTGFNPVKVTANGIEIYYDNYPSDSNTQFDVISVPITQNYTDCVIDIYTCTAFSLPFNVWLENSSRSTSNGVFFILTLIASLSTLVFSLFILLFSIITKRFKYQSKLLIFSGLTIFFGSISSIISAIHLRSPTLVPFNLFVINHVLIMLTSLFLSCTVYSTQENFNKVQRWFIVFFSFFILLFALNPFDFLTRIMQNIYPVICLIIIGTSIATLNRTSREFNRIVSISLCITLFSSFVYSINSVFTIFRHTTVLHLFLLSFFPIVYIYTIISNLLNKDIVDAERRIYTDFDSAFINKSINLSIELLSVVNKQDFAKVLSLNLKDLLCHDINLKSNNSDNAESLSVFTALKSSSGFRTAYTDDPSKLIDYSRIESLVNASANGNYLYELTHFDLIVKHEEETYIVCRVEGFRHELSNHLKAFIRMIYSNVNNAFSVLLLKENIEKTQDAVFYNLANICDSKSESTGQHNRRVSKYTKVMCLAYGMDEEESELVSRAAIMHDLGKLAIPEEIISKKGVLSPKEFEIMKLHVIWGYNILSCSPGKFMQIAAIIAQQHHERVDGSGYLGLTNDKIHKYAKIVSIADVFDALTSTRSYKETWTLDEARILINKKAGIEFDEASVIAFNNSFERIVRFYQEFKD